MILFIILMIILLILLIVGVLTISIGGAGFIILFSDIIVCAFIIVMIMKGLLNRKKDEN